MGFNLSERKVNSINSWNFPVLKFSRSTVYASSYDVPYILFLEMLQTIFYFNSDHAPPRWLMVDP